MTTDFAVSCIGCENGFTIRGRDEDSAARLVVDFMSQWGWHLPGPTCPDCTASTDIRVSRPLPGQWVLGCRCGRALSLRDMHRAPPSRRWPQSPLLVRPIVCRDCAKAVS